MNTALSSTRLKGLCWGIVVVNILAWCWAWVEFRTQPTLMGTALLAYMFGLRHAVDADHIAAIDNATRKLLQEGRSAESAGAFFSLGHAAVVIISCLFVALTASALDKALGDAKEIGSLISTLASAGFMLVLAFANLSILLSVWKTFRQAKNGGTVVADDLDMLLNRRGLLARLFRPLFRLVSRSWHLFPIGFLFGIGFDTATEIALFGLSSAQAVGGISFASIMVMPALFTAGMLLVDTLDGILMVRVYRWAFVRPIRKLYYNLTITMMSVVVAFFIGGIEVLSLLSDKMAFTGLFWRDVQALTDHFNTLGYAIIALFLISWGVSALIYRLKRYDEVDVNFE
ncbi:HoxN/HupN/NixA family nickel/cobalt transporter [Pantoea cypripedii]|uniref:Nickel/cobalt efflux system n=1 Tax=Pantoea cypripedii TaxID=55209 RepID=A0A1X1ELL3_PANCY|nr:HoxN/HupN/NixA family nickel/cobalt transporter [Pantoea cypripedii]MBP2200234.1 high-affinity nickel-transport protein [Pantoea cypripedii]ORM89827.1 nickel transporter [Pantoea cypripedii]